LLKTILTDALVSPVSSTDKACLEGAQDQAAELSAAHIGRKPQIKRSSTGPMARSEHSETKERRPQRSHTSSGPSNVVAFMPPGTAATRVQKHYRGHRVRLQVPRWREQLETVVEEEARKTVKFAESPTAESEDKVGRARARKCTPFVRKEDLDQEEYGLKICADEELVEKSSSNFRQGRKQTGFIKMDSFPTESDTEPDTPSGSEDSDVEARPSTKVVEIVVPDIPRDQPTWNLRAERKLTGYVKKADVPEASDSDSESESEHEV
jgi:hypothetical protein